jgi:hypothetical protein
MFTSPIVTVRGKTIPMNRFVAKYIEQISIGIVKSLDNTGEVNKLNLSVEGNVVNLILNGSIIPTNEFVNNIIAATLFGILSTLKGGEQADQVSIEIHK